MNSKTNFNILDYLKKKSVKQFILFFVIAFVFLIISKLSNDYKQTIALKIHLTNTEDEIMLQGDSLNRLEAYVEAKGFALIPLLFNTTKTIVLDAESDVNKKTDAYDFDVQKHIFLIEEQLGDSYKLLSISPDTLTMYYSKRASKIVPITLKNTISYSDGFDLNGNFKLDVDSVKIVGSSNEVEKIKTLSTVNLVLKDVNAKINEKVLVDISEYKNIEVFPKTIVVAAEVTRFTEGIIEVPVTIINKPKDVKINFFPKTISISYYVNLENYSAISTKDFIVECDYLDVEEKQNYLVPKIVKKPEFIKRISLKQKRIDFIKL